MSFTIFKFFLKRIARLTMSEGEYLAFDQRIRFMEFQQLRQNFPHIWDRFISTYETLQEEFDNQSYEEIAHMMVDSLGSYGTEVVHSFVTDLTNIGITLDVGTLDGAIEHAADVAHEVVGDVTDLTEDIGDVIEGIFDFITGIFS
jgi:hypothetical protein